MFLEYDGSLFTISQAAKACGISRSTIMRMEDKGLLSPSFQQPDTGYRYYSIYDIYKIQQVQHLTSLGLSAREICDHFASGSDPSQILSLLEPKFRLLKQAVEELRLLKNNTKHLSFEVVTLPEVVCCVKDASGYGLQDRYDTVAELSHYMIEKGYPFLASHPIFTINKTDDPEGQWNNEAADYTVCIPVIPEYAPENAVIFPECRAVSMLFYGSHNDQREAFFKLTDFVHAQGFHPAGHGRFLAFMAPQTGSQSQTDNYIMRYALPIE